MKKYGITSVDDLIVEFGFVIEEALEVMSLDDINDAFDVAWAKQKKSS